MPAFFTDILDRLQTFDFLETVKKKYHFQDSQTGELQEVAQDLLLTLRKEAFWERKQYPIQGSRQAENEGKKYEFAVMSLGSGTDRLQERYTARGLLMQSYMAEAFACEIFLQGYDAYHQFIRAETGWHPVKYHFFGSEEAFPLEMLPDLLKEYAPRITCNSSFCMLPEKSVAFVSELTRDEKLQCKSICSGCTNCSCLNRMADS